MSVNPFEGIAKKAQEDQLKEMRLAVLDWAIKSGWMDASITIRDAHTGEIIEREQRV